MTKIHDVFKDIILLNTMSNHVIIHYANCLIILNQNVELVLIFIRSI